MTFDYIIGSSESLEIGNALKPKYNYKKASDLFNKMWDIIADMHEYYDIDARQPERRYFMHMLTRNKGISLYINAMEEQAKYSPKEEQEQLEKIALEIIKFQN